MAIRYTYKKYEKYPEATEISETRERHKACGGAICSLLFISSIIALIIDFSVAWGMIFVAIASVLCFLWLLTKYDKVTEKKIARAIEKQDKMMKEVRDSKYLCEYINVLDKRGPGMCLICRANKQELSICEIKNEIGKRSIPICNECISKFKKNLQ